MDSERWMGQLVESTMSFPGGIDIGDSKAGRGLPVG